MKEHSSRTVGNQTALPIPLSFRARARVSGKLSKTCTMRIYPRGAISDRGITPSSPKPGPGGTRSKISGFSRASAARLRRLLAAVDGPSEWYCYGATFTIPGPPVTMEQWHRLWNGFRTRILRTSDTALIWRIELQKRKQPHVHCICWSKSPWIAHRLPMQWRDSLGILGPAEGPCRTTASMIITSDLYGRAEIEPGHVKVENRAMWPHAEIRAARIDPMDPKDRLGWWRYIAAHASKAKQEQLGWEGRQWGIVGRRHLTLAPPLCLELSHKAMTRLVRCLRRLTGCRFASGHGRQTWFVSPHSAERLTAWASSTAPLPVDGATAPTAPRPVLDSRAP